MDGESSFFAIMFILVIAGCLQKLSDPKGDL